MFKVIIMLCQNCGKEFNSTHTNEKYCSDNCRNEYSRKYQMERWRKKHPFETLICPQCKQEFIQTSTNQTHCSLSCRRKIWRKIPKNKVKEQNQSIYYRSINRLKINSHAKNHRQELKIQAIAYYSPDSKCHGWDGKGCPSKCSDITSLTIDHIDSNGTQHRKQEKIKNIYQWLKNKNYPSGYQVLCFNCQFIKIIEKNENHRVYTQKAINKRNYREKAKIEALFYYQPDLTCHGVNHKECPSHCEDIRSLSIDHVNDNGTEHRKELNGKNIYVWLRQNNYPEGYQVLCMNCQILKREK